MDKTIKFKIELETNGEKAMYDLRMSMDDVREAVKSVTTEADKLHGIFHSFSEMSIMVGSLNDVLGQTCDIINSLAEEYDGFDKGMRAVNTMAGLNGEGIEALTDRVKELSEEIPLAKDELAGGLYQVISNGVPEDNWIDFLNKSAKAAVGGIADLGETVTVTSTLIKNYGLEWDAAGEIQDKIQTTAKNGVTTFEQLAAALPRVSGNAATLGVSVDELMASFATLTGVSGNTAEVSTQLAAVFTALVKPSSEAAEMANEMGIAFDAASIRAAGGLQKFLTSLDATITAYSKSSGMLKEEIYGKLFGSAESLRALIPLTGELKDKFSENVEAMAGSAGTIDAAFDSMSGSGEAVAQMLKNQVGNWLEWGGAVASAVKPYVNFLAQMGMAINGIALLSSGVVKLVGAIKTFIGAETLAAVASLRNTIQMRVEAAARNILAAAGYTAASGTTAMTVAVTALYAALSAGIALAIAGLSAALSGLFASSGDAKDGLEKLNEGEEEMVRKSGEVKAALDGEIRKLKGLIDTHGDAKEEIAHLNKEYGEAFGNHATAAEWYDVLTKKSKDYAMALGYEAQMRMLSTQIAEKQVQLEADYDKRKELWESGKAQETRTKSVGSSNTGYVQTVSYKADSKAYKEIKDRDAGLIQDIQNLNKQLDKAMSKAGEYRSKIGTSPKITPEKKQEEKPHTSSSGREPKKAKPEEEAVPQLGFRPMEAYKREAEGIRGSISSIGDMMQSQVDRVNGMRAKATWIEELRDAGVVSADAASEAIRGINDELDALGAKKVDIDIDSKSARQAKERMETATDAIGQMGNSLSSLGGALEMPVLNVAGTLAQAIATMALGYAQATSKSAKLGPWGWIAFAATGLAQLAAMVSAVKGMSKFADGGIAYGPTIGIFGEYAGASHNPEVVAPLDKLRGLLPAGGVGVQGGTVEFRIKGRSLEGVLRKRERLMQRG